MKDETAPLSASPERTVPPDAELVARAVAGDAGAFELLVRRHYRAAFALGCAILGHRADAEDVCHDAFVRAAARLEDCRQPDRFAQWLHAIVRNLAKNHLTRPAIPRTEPLDHETARSGEDVGR